MGMNQIKQYAVQDDNLIIISEGFPGREIIFQSREIPNLRMLTRMYIDPEGPTLYTLQIIAEDGNLDFPEAQAFFDSFVVF